MKKLSADTKDKIFGFISSVIVVLALMALIRSSILI